jgi:uncharacterized protein YuzE
VKITYDPRADAMNIKFQEGKYDISQEVADGIIIDYTKTGKVIRIEILDASKRMPRESIRDIVIGLPVQTRHHVVHGGRSASSQAPRQRPCAGERLKPLLSTLR